MKTGAGSIASQRIRVGDLIPRLGADLERYAMFGEKVSGGPGDLGAADWIAERMRGLGYAVQRQEFDVPFFEPLDCKLVAGDAIAAIYPQSPVVPTSAAGVTAQLALVRAPFEASDAKDRIALLVLPYARHASITSPLIEPLVKAAEAAGAVALIIVPVGPTGDIVALNCPIDGPLAKLPTAVLAPAQAEPFLIAARNRTPAALVLHGRAGRRATCNLQGTLQRGSGWIALSTPRTGWFDCASERGTGTAAFLALAAWAPQRFPDLSVFLMNNGAHEYHFAGAHRAMQFAPPPGDTLVWVHLGASLATRDQLEFRGQTQALPSADPNRTVMASEAILQPVRDAFQGLSGLECPLPVIEGVSELATILSHGYEAGFAVLGIPRVIHTKRDDLQAVDAEILAPVVLAHMSAIEAVVHQSVMSRAQVMA